MSVDLSTSFTNLSQLNNSVNAESVTATFNTFGGRNITLKTANKEYTFKMYQLFELVASLGEKTLNEAKGDKKEEVKEIRDLMTKVTALDENLKKIETFPNFFVKIMTIIRRFFGNLVHDRSHIFNELEANLNKTAAPKNEAENPVKTTPTPSETSQTPKAVEGDKVNEAEVPPENSASNTNSTDKSGSTADEKPVNDTPLQAAPGDNPAEQAKANNAPPVDENPAL